MTLKEAMIEISKEKVEDFNKNNSNCSLELKKEIAELYDRIEEIEKILSKSY